MNQTITFIDPDSLVFPPLERALAEPNGLLAIGGDLSTDRLINAYTNGIFPWFGENEPIMWWSPTPRAIIPTNAIKVNRTLRKVLNRQPYKVTINKDFSQVITLCADAPFRQEGTWILPKMIHAYCNLHEKGYAHSVEVWQDDILVGGLYGVAINGFFSGESMFYSAPNASKIALVALGNFLKSVNILMIDCQLTNPFLEDMGAIDVSREQFTRLKKEMSALNLPNDFWTSKELTY